MRVLAIYVLVLAAFCGYLVISRAPQAVHAALLAAATAISGITVVGSFIMAGAQHSRLATIVGFIAVICATTSMVGGFLVADRMARLIQRPKITEEAPRAPTNS